ncbi:beta-lactamase family protein [Streptomyces sp. NBC_01511]|uniref:serine hydrolase domain-containing protein n=1 Tax=Streptomyces sp. NBC_01511 TaxID=2903889 RepID=UPI00386B17C5
MTTSLVRQTLPRPRPRPRVAPTGVHGTTAPGFASVRHSFERACRDSGPPASQGAALAVVQDGELVVDLWHGTADPVTGTPWTGDTLEPVLTGSHGILATAVLLLADMGALALDRPVADYWPEFATRGEDAVTLRDVLTFTARLPGVPHGPWPAGCIAAEVIRRVDGRDLDLFFLEEIAGPLGLDIHFGLVPDQLPHIARLSYDADFRARFPAPDGGADDGGADGSGADGSGAVLFGRVVVPSLGAYASARGLARLQAVLASDAVRPPGEEPLLLSRRTLDQARNLWAEEPDPLFGAFGHRGPGGIAYRAWPQARAGAGAAWLRGRLTTGGPDARILDEVAGAVVRAPRTA